MAPYRYLDHTADLRVEVYADSLPGLFVEAGTALFDVIAGLRSIRVDRFMEVQARGEDSSELFVDWLRELLYRFAGEGMLLSTFEIISLSGTEIRARCGGEAFDSGRHHVKNDIKAVTYHGLRIDELNGTFRVAVVLDI